MNLSITQREAVAGVVIADIALDGEGRIAITSRELAERIAVARAAKRREKAPKPTPNTNCSGCNTVKGCGPINEECNPNTVPNCGCRKLG
jgi:hypothetical protein